MYRVGVIGCRNIGIRHGNGVEGIASADLVAACDLVPELLSAYEERFKPTCPNLALYTDFDEMLAKANWTRGRWRRGTTGIPNR